MLSSSSRRKIRSEHGRDESCRRKRAKRSANTTWEGVARGCALLHVLLLLPLEKGRDAPAPAGARPTSPRENTRTVPASHGQAPHYPLLFRGPGPPRPRPCDDPTVFTCLDHRPRRAPPSTPPPPRRPSLSPTLSGRRPASFSARAVTRRCFGRSPGRAWCLPLCVSGLGFPSSLHTRKSGR